MKNIFTYSNIRNQLKNNKIAYFLFGFYKKIMFEATLLLKIIEFKNNKCIGEDELPIPPPKLRFRVHGALDETSFLDGGKSAHRDIKLILGKNNIKLSENINYLDFGCGCARIFRHFLKEGLDFKAFGTDIDSESISWCRKEFGEVANWETNSPLPPLHYSKAKFDVIIANSIFTHLDEEYQDAWLCELCRVMSTDGIGIFSIHGEPVWRNFEMEGLRDIMKETGFYFLHSSLGIRNLAGLPAFYQTTFHSKKYIHEKWSKYFEIIDYIDSGIGNHQTAVVVRPKTN